MALIYSLFCILKALVIYYLVYSFCIFIIAFLIAAACCVTKGDGASNLTIQKQAPKTKSIGTRPPGLAVLLIALKAIYKAISLLILGISVVIIQQAHYSGLWQRSTILIKLCNSTKTDFVLTPIVTAQCLNSLLTKFFPVSIVIKSSGFKQLLIQYIYRMSQVYLVLISCSHLPV